MNFIFENYNWALILIALASGTGLVWQVMQKTRGGGVGTAEAVRLINREKGVLIDVSDATEYAASHAVGARNIPLNSLAEAKGLPSNKTLPLLLLCPNGSRAGRAAAQLRKAGHEAATAVSGGTTAWRDAGLPVERSPTV